MQDMPACFSFAPGRLIRQRTRGNVYKKKRQEEINMSPKELSYIEDALGHEKFLKTQCQEAVKNLQDPELKNCAEQLSQTHQQIFDSIYNLI